MKNIFYILVIAAILFAVTADDAVSIGFVMLYSASAFIVALLNFEKQEFHIVALSSSAFEAIVALLFWLDTDSTIIGKAGIILFGALSVYHLRQYFLYYRTRRQILALFIKEQERKNDE